MYLVTCTVSVYSGSVHVSGYLYCVCLQWQCWCIWLPVLCLSTVAVLVYLVTCTVYVYSGSVGVSGYLYCVYSGSVDLVTCTVFVYSARGSVGVSGYLYCVCLQW